MNDDFEPDDFEPEASDDFEPDEESPGAFEQFSRAALPKIGAFAKGVGETVGAVSSTIDKYTGAPIRHGVSRLQEGENPFEGYDYEQTPQWSDIYAKAGVSTEKNIPSPLVLNPYNPEANKFSPAEVAGGITGAVVDPLNFVPLGTLSKGAKVAGGIAESASKAMQPIARGLGRFAEERAAKQALGAGVAGFREAAGSAVRGAADIEKAQAKVRGLGRTMLNEGDIGLFSTTEKIGEKASKKFAQLQSEIGEIGKMVDTAVPEGAISGKAIAEKIADYAAQIPETEGGKALQNRLLAEAANFEKMGNMTFSDAQRFKNQFQYKPQVSDAFESSQDSINSIKRIIGEAMEDGADGAASRLLTSTNPIDQKTAQRLMLYRNLKKKYGTYKQVAKSATNRKLQNLSNNYVSPMNWLTGVGAGGSAIASGADPITSAVIGGAVTGATQFARNRGGSFAARSADLIRKMVESNPDKFKKWGSALYKASVAGDVSLTTTHQLLMQSDPEYRQLILNQGKDTP